MQGMGIGEPCPELEDKNWEKRRNGGMETAEEATVIDSGRIMGEAGLER